MDKAIRKPLQGIKNIIRFNWHFYLFAAGALFVLLIARHFFALAFNTGFTIIILLLITNVLLSLLASLYIYDLSQLYLLKWIDVLEVRPYSNLVNIHAGFDETSELLSVKYYDCNLKVLDFYNPKDHTEISIKRARKVYPPFPGTQQISTSAIPLSQHSVDVIFVLLAAHEIRNKEERIMFLKNLRETLKSEGKIVILEHLRDLSNFIVYNAGCFHFFSKAEWLLNFEYAGLKLNSEIKVTPFLSAFILEPDGTLS